MTRKDVLQQKKSSSRTWIELDKEAGFEMLPFQWNSLLGLINGKLNSPVDAMGSDSPLCGLLMNQSTGSGERRLQQLRHMGSILAAREL
ncbi:hypothetical protein MJT46_007951 [Ovis ammon polii x Ovis aries]|nr:hypothetical protein MJT46_007951 [Ovis ammon polii x Ovis aries]